MELQDYIVRFGKIKDEITAQKESKNWIRPEHFTPWVDRYNILIAELNKQLGRNIPKFGTALTDYSGSGKTMTSAAVTSLQKAIDSTLVELRNTLDDMHRFHCFKIGSKCPHAIRKNYYKFFVGMPFSNKNKDSYEYGIKMMLQTHGIDKIFKADEKFDRVDVMCKICRAIQESEYTIINITDQNPNVMFELGLAYGLNKYVFLIKDSTTPVVSDLSGLEYIEYTHAGDLSNKLRVRLTELGII